MLYYNRNKDFSVYATGKHGTTSMYEAFSDFYKEKNAEYLKENIYLMDDRDSTDIGYYRLTAGEYYQWQEASPIKNKYVVIRDPIERMASGLCTNLGAEAWKQKVTDCRILEDSIEMPNEESVYDSSYWTNDWHIGAYLQYLSGCPNTTFIELEDLGSFWEKTVGIKLSRLNTNERKLLGRPVSEFKEFYKKRIMSGKVPIKFMENLKKEIEAYDIVRER